MELGILINFWDASLFYKKNNKYELICEFALIEKI
jgi:hypothetical protein